MNYPASALTVLEELYLHARNICAEIDKFHPDLVIGLAHSGWMPVVVAQTLWAQTHTEPFPPCVRTNIGREKHEVYIAHFGNTFPVYCCAECCNGWDRLGHFLAWVTRQPNWLETLHGQIASVFSGAPARILVVDDLFGGLRSSYTVLALLETLYPQAKAYVFAGRRDLTDDFVTAWLEEFQPALLPEIRETSSRARFQHPIQKTLKPFITGSEDISPERLDWQFLGPASPAVAELLPGLPIETILSAPDWAKGLACGYALQRLRGEIVSPRTMADQDDERVFQMSDLALSPEARLAARAWLRQGVTRTDVAEIFGDTPEGIQKGLAHLASPSDWHPHGQGEAAVYILDAQFESWIYEYDQYERYETTPNPGYHTRGFGEFLPGQVWAGAYPLASDSRVKEQPFKDLLSAGVDIFINLSDREDWHRTRPYGRVLLRLGRQMGIQIQIHSLPLPFRTGPTARQVRKVLNVLSRALQAGQHVYLHAGNNLQGQAPLILVCLLIQQGVSAEEAIAQVNEFWLKTLHFLVCSPLTEEELAFIRAWAGKSPQAG